ncbi:MAG: hypothetical protein V1738_03485 [Patescibacteria group bacterium]
MAKQSSTPESQNIANQIQADGATKNDRPSEADSDQTLTGPPCEADLNDGLTVVDQSDDGQTPETTSSVVSNDSEPESQSAPVEPLLEDSVEKDLITTPIVEEPNSAAAVNNEPPSAAQLSLAKATRLIWTKKNGRIAQSEEIFFRHPIATANEAVKNAYYKPYKHAKNSDQILYPDEYGIRSVAEQVTILRQLLGQTNLTYDESVAERQLPPNAEGWFAVVRWEILGLTYGEAVLRILAAIKSTRPFWIQVSRDKFENDYFQQCAETAQAFQKISAEQAGQDILIVPCQFGARYDERTHIRNKLTWPESDDHEFPLDSFSVGCMLLTHPERLLWWFKHHYIVCLGDIMMDLICDLPYNPRLLHPQFIKRDKKLEYMGDYSCGNGGFASGFLTEPLGLFHRPADILADWFDEKSADK